MQALFYAVALYGLYFFIFRRKRFDFVATAFVSEVIYFAPGFVGSVSNPYFMRVEPYIPIVPSAYAIWIAAFAATILTGKLYNPPAGQGEWRELRTTPPMDFAIILTVLGAFVASIYFEGEGIFSANKNEVLDTVGRFFILFATASQVGTVAFLVQGKFVKALVPLGGLAFLLYAGFRNDTAIAAIAVATYIAARRGIWTYLRPRYLASILGVALLLFFYKPLLYSYRAGRLDIFYGYLGGEGYLRSTFLSSEPFVVQAILNEVIIRNMPADPMSLVYSAIAFVPFLGPLLGVRPEEVSFSFQDQIFPNLTYGLSPNIFAQFYATLGWTGIILFILAQNWALVKVSKGMASRSPFIKLALLGIGSFLAFYIHRNGVSNSFSIMNRVAVTVFWLWVVSFGLNVLLWGGRFGAAREPAAEAPVPSRQVAPGQVSPG
jgi:hypothetical protein